jgi:hypothetical protein
MPHCYKCRATDDLSLKKEQKGVMTFICRPCRREQMRQYKARKQPIHEHVGIDPIQWAKWAKESRTRIIERHKASQTAC